MATNMNMSSDNTNPTSTKPPKRKRDRKKEGGCYHCGSEKHKAKACPQAICRICQQSGHDVGGCPKKPVAPVDLGLFNARGGAFTYAELFCGMGGFRVALDKLQGQCVFASEVDRHCRSNYGLNFGGDRPAGDICQIPTSQIPNHDVLVGGFPCQPFSSSGKQNGLDDPRGQLFREIVRVLKDKQPRGFILENVRGLLLHDNGTTLKLILKELGGCNYNVQYQVVNAATILPQERNRLFLVGVHTSRDMCGNKFEVQRDLEQNENERDASYTFPIFPDLKRGVQDSIHRSEEGSQIDLDRLSLNPNQLQKVRAQKYTKQHPEARFLSDLSKPSKTLQSSYMKYMVGSQFIPCGNEWRRFSAREAARLQGFPEDFILCAQRAHHMLGNAVAPPVIAMLAAPLLSCIGYHPVMDEVGEWGWMITQRMLLEACPNDSRRHELKQKLHKVMT